MRHETRCGTKEVNDGTKSLIINNHGHLVKTKDCQRTLHVGTTFTWDYLHWLREDYLWIEQGLENCNVRFLRNL